jgi:PAS domain S-box-containing protein
MRERLSNLSSPLRILLIEDSEDDARLLLRELKRAGYDPIHERVDNLLDLEKALDAKTWDVVTGDYAIPGFNGLAALAFLRAKGVGVPFIIVSGKIDEDVAVEAMRHGAGDYVLKNNLQRLVPTIERELREAEVRRKQQLAEEELRLERERLGDVAAHAHCGLLLLDDEARVVYANRMAETWFGRIKELKGRPCRKIFSLIDERECPVSQAIQTSAIVNSDVPVVTVTGERKFVHVSAAPLRDGNGELKQVTAVLVDITERKQAEQLGEAMNDIRTAIASTLDFDKIARLAVAKSMKAVGCDTGIIALWEDDDWVIKYLAGYPFLNVGYRLSNGKAQALAAAENTLEPIVVNDAVNDERVDKDVIAALGARSYLASPLISRNRVIGWLAFVNISDPMFFTQAQIDFGAKAASSVALALENARLFEAKTKAQKEAEFELTLSNHLLKAADALAGALDLPETLESIAKIVSHATGRSRVTISMIDKVTNELVVTCCRGLEGYPVGSRLSLDKLTPELVRAIANKNRFIMDFTDPKVKTTASSKRRAKHLSCKVALFMPLIVSNEVIGTLSVDEPGADRSFTDREIRLVEGIAAQASTAIEKARLYEEQKETAGLSAALIKIDAIIHSSLSLEQVMKEALDEAVGAIGCEAGGINLLEDSYWRRAAVCGLPKKFLGERLTADQNRVAALVARTGKPVIINDAANDERMDRAFAEKYGIRSGMALPIFAKKVVEGVIFFSYRSAPTPLSRGQMDFAAKLAASLSLALENARLYAQQHEIAETLQKAALALPENLAAIDFGHLYRSATEAAKVGGDFYDIFELDHERVGIIIGDVAGKGIEAATLSGLISNTIRTFAHQRYAPGTVITLTNDTFVKRSKGSTFVTVLFGILNTKSGVFSYCNAGHPPPIVKRRSSARVLENRSPAIGMIPDLKFDQRGTVLDKGDILILYTDGIVEARRGLELFGEERLVEVIGQLDRPVSEIPEAIFRRAVSFAQGTLADDVALLAVCFSK